MEAVHVPPPSVETSRPAVPSAKPPLTTTVIGSEGATSTVTPEKPAGRSAPACVQVTASSSERHSEVVVSSIDPHAIATALEGMAARVETSSTGRSASAATGAQAQPSPCAAKRPSTSPAITDPSDVTAIAGSSSLEKPMPCSQVHAQCWPASRVVRRP